MPLPRGITLPSGSRPVYGLSRFDAPPSRVVAQWQTDVARPRSTTVAGAAQELAIWNALRASSLPHLFPDYPALKIQHGHLEPRRRVFS
jgi:hypothetical protein